MRSRTLRILARELERKRPPTLDDLTHDMGKRIAEGNSMTKAEIRQRVKEL